MGLLKKILFLIFLIAIVVYGALFAVENDTAVPLDLLFLEMPALRVSLWLVAAFILGCGIGLLISSLKLLQSRGQYQLLSRKLAKAEKEINQLRVNSPKS